MVGGYRTRMLDNKYEFVVALNENREANGNILSLGANYDEKRVKSLCMGENNCILDISARVY